MFQRRMVSLFKTVSDLAVGVIACAQITSQEKIIITRSKMTKLWVFLCFINNIQDMFTKISFLVYKICNTSVLILIFVIISSHLLHWFKKIVITINKNKIQQ